MKQETSEDRAGQMSDFKMAQMWTDLYKLLVMRLVDLKNALNSISKDMIYAVAAFCFFLCKFVQLIIS